MVILRGRSNNYSFIDKNGSVRREVFIAFAQSGAANSPHSRYYVVEIRRKKLLNTTVYKMTCFRSLVELFLKTDEVTPSLTNVYCACFAL